MAINGVVKTGTGPVYVNENGLTSANIHSVFVSQTILGGRLAVTLGDATLAATGTLKIAGTLSKTLGDVTLAATGTLPGNGALAVTLDDATLAATATTTLSGAAAITLGAATLSATATTTLSGAASIGLGDATSSGTGTLLISASATVTLDGATLAATAALLISASLGATLEDLTLEAAGTSAQVTEGTLAVTLDDVTLSATATLTGEATDLVERAKGLGGRSSRRRRKRPAITGRVALYLPPLWLTAAGAFDDPPEGELRGSIGIPLGVRSRGSVGAGGSACMPIGIQLRVTATGASGARGRVRAEFATIALQSRGRHDHFTSGLALALLPELLEGLDG